MLNLIEAEAHLELVQLTAAVLMARKGSDRRLLAQWQLNEACWDLLPLFRARCPQCVGVIQYGPVVDGTRLFACRCGWGGSESSIWHGVPAVEGAK